jgi:hypothetical protein
MTTGSQEDRMQGIGNAEDARLICEWVRGSDSLYGMPERAEQGRAPEGWRHVDNGAYRSVWRSPEGVAYKVCHRTDYDSQQSDEVANLRIAWTKEAPEGCRLPRFNSFDINDEIIVAMELIKGRRLRDSHPNKRGHFYEVMRDVTDVFRLRDMHDENVIVEEGTELLVPVDFGC